jgi:hypothetical protein
LPQKKYIEWFLKSKDPIAAESALFNKIINKKLRHAVTMERRSNPYTSSGRQLKRKINGIKILQKRRAASAQEEGDLSNGSSFVIRRILVRGKQEKSSSS